MPAGSLSGRSTSTTWRSIQGIVDGCKEGNSPLILQISKGARQYANVVYLRKLIDAALTTSGDLPIVMHLDHGDSFELCKACVDDGFTSVMIDASHLPFEGNIELTRKVVEYAHAHGVSRSEAELGKLAGEEEHVKVEERDAVYTNPAQAADFVKRSGCDSLAVAIGTSHGAYKFATTTPKLNFERLAAIQAAVPGVPLVLHGASSVPPDLVEKCVKFGGEMKGAQGVPEAMMHKAADRVRHLQDQHRHRSAAGHDCVDPRGVRHQPQGIRSAEVSRPGTRGDQDAREAEASNAKLHRQSRCRQVGAAELGSVPSN